MTEKPDPIRVSPEMPGQAGRVGEALFAIAKDELVRATERFGS